MTYCTSDSCCEATTTETRPSAETTYRPAIDMFETETEYRLEVDLPGVSKEDVELDLRDGLLAIRGKAAARRSETAKNHIVEYGVGDFERRIRLGKRVDADGIRAELSDGQLTLHLPKVSSAQPRRIELA